ncbi:SRPBCC domain-containing protein [Nocardiopsis ganjiahuensis]|uniref:SRPBCC domain-containing protein n=1 Tax=Nocardiopsis ganjiahuensis TaxID=239984 RepID=UPI000348474A|nr:SRPBCC domain-containing protein [Nocardiopsis ganjiahuensis]
MTTPNPTQALRRGTLGTGPDGAFRIRFERVLAHTPERVWAWITEPGRLALWLPGCAIDPRVGGAVSFDFGDEGTATGVVGEAVPPGEAEGSGTQGVLVHSWCWEGVPDSVVRWTVEAAPEGTRLTLVHSELLPGPAADFATGWHVMLDALDLAAEGRSADDAWNAVGEVAELYADASE